MPDRRAPSSNVAEELIRKAERREALFGIVGLGYVGLPLAMELAKAGYRVLGFDISQRVVDGLNDRRSHVKDISDAQLQEALDAEERLAALRLADQLLGDAGRFCAMIRHRTPAPSRSRCPVAPG